jgi:hypothetical protein
MSHRRLPILFDAEAGEDIDEPRAIAARHGFENASESTALTPPRFNLEVQPYLLWLQALLRSRPKIAFRSLALSLPAYTA